MKFDFKKIMAVGIIALTSSLAHADFYVGGQFASLKVEEDADVGEPAFDYSFTALVGRFGTSFNDYLSLEARLGFGISGDTIEGVDIDLKTMGGAYLRAGLPLESNLYPYVLLGMTEIEVEASISGRSASDSENDMSIGLGADYYFSEKMGGNLEYVNYFDKDGTSVDSLSLGLIYKF